MKTKISLLTLMAISTLMMNAQIIMNIHQNNGTVLEIPLNTIDSITFTMGSQGGVTFDGYTYSSIIIGNGQEWMAENLRTTIYANGDPIPNVTDGTQWSTLNTGAWAHYENDNQYEFPYGKLYNWLAVNDSRNVCPTGWHVPSYEEWQELCDYLGGYLVAGGKMKSTGTQYWSSPNAEATNESGFSGLPGGNLQYDGSFANMGNFGSFWASLNWGPSGAARVLRHFDGEAHDGSFDTTAGCSIRCLKD